jgi:guanylate cyclase
MDVSVSSGSADGAGGGFFERLAARTHAIGALGMIESPRSAARIASVALLASAVNASISGTVFLAFGETRSGLVTVAHSAVFFCALAWFLASGNMRGPLLLFVGASIFDHIYVHFDLGGYANSGAFLMWGALVTVGATLLLKRAEVLALGAVYATLAIAFVFVEPTLSNSRPSPRPGLPAFNVAHLLVSALIIVVPLLMYVLGRLVAERARSESLLLNVLPRSIADRLKVSPAWIADTFDSCTVLFADLVGFTGRTQQISPGELIVELNSIFSRFDQLLDEYGVEKIKTIGDGYMAVAGVPVPRVDHVDAACSLALAMQSAMAEIRERLEVDLQLRIGIDTGAVVAGVIGSRRFAYDLWGDTVNTASRMESQGQPGRIQVTEAVRDSAAGHFAFTPAGVIAVKGKGPMETFLLDGPGPKGPSTSPGVEKE